MDSYFRIASALAGDLGFTLLRHGHNRGKGRAIRTALPWASGRFTIIQDADLELDPADIPRMLAVAERSEADVVFGSRFLGKPYRMPGYPLTHRLGISLLNSLVRLFYGLRLTDEAAGYKLFPTGLLRSLDLQCERFEFCPEVVAKCALTHTRVREVAVTFSPRTRNSGKKLGLSAGIKALSTLTRYRLSLGRVTTATRSHLDNNPQAMPVTRERPSRRRFCTLAALLGLSCVLLTASATQLLPFTTALVASRPEISQPILTIPPEQLALGVIDVDGEALPARLTLQNPQRQAIHVERFEMPCGCISLTPRSATIPPGASVSLEVTLGLAPLLSQATSLSPLPFRATIIAVVRTTQGERRLAWTLTGRATHPLMSSPSTVNLGYELPPRPANFAANREVRHERAQSVARSDLRLAVTRSYRAPS